MYKKEFMTNEEIRQRALCMSSLCPVNHPEVCYDMKFHIMSKEQLTAMSSIVRWYLWHSLVAKPAVLTSGLVGIDIGSTSYGEAMGLMKTLSVLGYGAWHMANIPGRDLGFDEDYQNLFWWFCDLQRQVEREFNQALYSKEGEKLCPNK